MNPIEIGRLLRAGITGFVVGCRASQASSPAFGSLVRVPLDSGYEIYGLIYDIHIDDDGLVRQLITVENVDENIIADNRINRNVPLEMSVLSVGYQKDGRILPLLPPSPPLSLDRIYQCTVDEVCRFSSSARFGYFRHILNAGDIPVSELLAAHLQDAGEKHKQLGNPDWINQATQELIILLRDDYPSLMSVLGALRDISL